MRKNSGQRMTSAAGKALAEEWRVSGQSMQQFAHARGIRPHVVRYWVAKTKETDGEKDFVVVTRRSDAERHEDVPVPSAAVVVVLPASAGWESGLCATVRAALQGAGQ